MFLLQLFQNLCVALVLLAAPRSRQCLSLFACQLVLRVLRRALHGFPFLLLLLDEAARLLVVIPCRLVVAFTLDLRCHLVAPFMLRSWRSAQAEQLACPCPNS